MEAICFSETPGFLGEAQLYHPENLTLHNHCRYKLKPIFCVVIYVFDIYIPWISDPFPVFIAV
jgi:hypothetical protein